MNKQPAELRVVVGLGKTGLSCVRYLVQQGFGVVVVDSRLNPPCMQILQQAFPQVKVYLGGFYPEILEQAAEIILSPGISMHEPEIQKIVQKGVRIIGDIELLVREVDAPIVAITGSNGKSTVTTLVGKMAEAAGIKVKVGGNLGIPVLDLLDQTTQLYVLELSSFQLETTCSLYSAAAVVLNISSDHMDRYSDFKEYLKTKQRIYLNSQIAVVNRDNPLTSVDAKLPKRIISFGLSEPNGKNFGIIGDSIVFEKQKLFPTNELKINGMHNVSNVLAALSLGTAIQLPFDAMLKAVREFCGLPHRCQWVTDINGVHWYNDSKGTNVGATKSAIEGLGVSSNGKIVLIAGGIGKGADFTDLYPAVEKYVRAIVLIGRDAKIIAQALANTSKILFAASMADAVAICKREALSGDAVLLSPACASFDMFNNFEHRGEVFMQEVRKNKG